MIILKKNLFFAPGAWRIISFENSMGRHRLSLDIITSWAQDDCRVYAVDGVLMGMERVPTLLPYIGTHIGLIHQLSYRRILILACIVSQGGVNMTCLTPWVSNVLDLVLLLRCECLLFWCIFTQTVLIHCVSSMRHATLAMLIPNQSSSRFTVKLSHKKMDLIP